MSETGRIEVVPRTLTDAEWVDAIGLAMKANLGTELQRRVVTELLTIRQAHKLRFVVEPDQSIRELQTTT